MAELIELAKSNPAIWAAIVQTVKIIGVGLCIAFIVACVITGLYFRFIKSEEVAEAELDGNID